MNKIILTIITAIVTASITLIPGCAKTTMTSPPPPITKTVPHEAKWGIYELDLTTQDVKLIYSSVDEIYTSALRLNNKGDKFVFAQKADGNADNDMEIYSLEINGTNLIRLTNNKFWDLYPVWSPDDAHIAFISKRDKDLDIYVMDADGNNDRKLFDSGSNDADIDWAGNIIVFTSRFKIWRMNDNGTQPIQLANPLNAGQWGKANLPIGDYDPRLSPDGTKVVFERLEDPSTLHGNYNIFVINSDGAGETRLTNNGYSQGLASWSHSGTKLIYVVAAINGEGKYDIYMINADGTDNRNITPNYFPANFLCLSPIFSSDDSKIFFIGQWWE